MTFAYANREPPALHTYSLDGPTSVIKWSHSVISEESFINEWQAIETARSLAFELGVYDGVHSWLSPCDPVPQESHPRRSSSRRLGFSSEVDVLIGMEDDFTMHNVTVSSACVGRGLFPWCAGLQRGGDYCDLSSAPLSFVQNAEQRSLSILNWLKTINPMHLCAEFAIGNSGSPGSESMPAESTSLTTVSSGTLQASSSMPSTVPNWLQDLFALLFQEGITEDPEEGPVIFVNSYYINHLDHQSHSEPRPLRFDIDWRDWENGVRLIWEDFIDPNVPFVISIVRPDPPHFAFRGTCATVIVHQHQTPTNAAILITTVHAMAPQTRFEETAHSTALQLSHPQLFALARVEALCSQRQAEGFGLCTIHAGHHQLPDNEPVNMVHGLGLHIRIPAPLSPAEIEENFVRRIGLQRAQDPRHVWNPRPPDDQPETEGHTQRDDPEDEVSMMARQPPRRRARLRHLIFGAPLSSLLTSTASLLGYTVAR